MSWNIFKRVAELEQWVKDLNDFHFGNSRRIKAVEDELSRLEQANKLLVTSNQVLIRRQENIGERVKDIAHELVTQSRQPSPYAAAPVCSEPVFSKDEVEKEKKRQYQREWYAKKQAKLKREKNVQAAREKKNAYHRAYYARKKGATK